MDNIDYAHRIDQLVSSWRDDVYDGVIRNDVLPAVQIYAHASLQEMTDVYDVRTTFPMLPAEVELYDHYGNALFARLSSACTSIRNGLQAIGSHLDCHAAIAASRRAHESLWQMFWLCNPTKDGNARMRRQLTLTYQEIEDTLRYFSYGLNPEVEGKLRSYQSSIEQAIGKSKYLTKYGREEYQSFFSSRFNDPIPADLERPPAGLDTSAIEWSMMCNMTHPNVVFDWIIQVQEDSQNEMDRLQLLPIIGAMGMTCNLSTLMMEQARFAEGPTTRVNTTFQRIVFSAQTLMEVQRH